MFNDFWVVLVNTCMQDGLLLMSASLLRVFVTLGNWTAKDHVFCTGDRHANISITC